jgi:hypothetical protein
LALNLKLEEELELSAVDNLGLWKIRKEDAHRMSMNAPFPPAKGQKDAHEALPGQVSRSRVGLW